MWLGKPSFFRIIVMFFSFEYILLEQPSVNIDEAILDKWRKLSDTFILFTGIVMRDVVTFD